MKTDAQLQTDVLSELKWDPSVSHEHIGVAVNDAVVTLSGTVPNYYEKYAAEKAAQKVSGVKAIVEKITVKLAGSSVRDDEDLARAITEQFRWNIQVPDQLVKVKVQDGWVELSGEVHWAFQKYAALAAVRSLTGVKGVTDLMTIKAKPVKAEVVKQKIKEALQREATREAQHISVEIKGNKAVLNGRVNSFTDRENAERAAWNAPGITSIESNLTVQSYQ